jgi:hypothetical protein
MRSLNRQYAYHTQQPIDAASRNGDYVSKYASTYSEQRHGFAPGSHTRIVHGQLLPHSAPSQRASQPKPIHTSATKEGVAIAPNSQHRIHPIAPAYSGPQSKCLQKYCALSCKRGTDIPPSLVFALPCPILLLATAVILVA